MVKNEPISDPIKGHELPSIGTYYAIKPFSSANSTLRAGFPMTEFFMSLRRLRSSIGFSALVRSWTVLDGGDMIGKGKRCAEGDPMEDSHWRDGVDVDKRSLR